MKKFVLALWIGLLVVGCLPHFVSAQVVGIVNNQVRIDGRRVVGIADCLSSPGAGPGFDGGCRRAIGDCPGPDEVGERFVDWATYSAAYRAAGFNMFRAGRGGACSPSNPDQIVPILQQLKKDGWAVWVSLFSNDDPLLDTAAGLTYVDELHAKFSPYTDIWEIAGEGRPSTSWLSQVAARLRQLDALSGKSRLITTSWNDNNYAPYVDFNSPHWYYGGSDIPGAFHNAIGQEYAKMPGKPMVFGETGNQGQNWSNLNVARLSDFLLTARYQDTGIVFWNTSNAKDYTDVFAANIYLGPAERATVTSILASEVPVSQPTPTPTPTPTPAPTPTPTPAPPAATNYAGYIDQGDCGMIVGWAADRNRLNTSINVSIYDGTTLLTTILANQMRTDVGSHLGDNGLHGFSFVTPSSLKNGAAHSLSIRFETGSTNLTNGSFQLTCSTAPANYAGYVDQADCGLIVGWAADLNRLNTAINVSIYDGTTLLTTVLANQLRSDVGSHLGDNGLHGFSIVTPASLKNGAAHSLSIRFETASTNLANGSPQLTCGTTATNYTGYVDQADCSMIVGWAADLNRLNMAINVSIYDGTTLLTTVLANQLRGDVGSHLGDNGLHGFRIATPASLKNGATHSLSVRFETASTNLINGSRALTCN